MSPLEATKQTKRTRDSTGMLHSHTTSRDRPRLLSVDKNFTYCAVIPSAGHHDGCVPNVYNAIHRNVIPSPASAEHAIRLPHTADYTPPGDEGNIFMSTSDVPIANILEYYPGNKGRWCCYCKLQAGLTGGPAFPSTASVHRRPTPPTGFPRDPLSPEV